MASAAAAAFGARFRRGKEAPKAEPRVGEILSDSSEESVVETGPRRRADESKSSESHSSGPRSGKKAPGSVLRGKQVKRSGSRKWYSDSESDEEGEFEKVNVAASVASRTHEQARQPADDQAKTSSSNQPEEDEAADAVNDSSASTSEPPLVDQPAVKEPPPKLKRLTDFAPQSGNESDASGSGILSPLSDSEPSRGAGKKQTSFQKLMAKTKTLSPFGARNRGFDHDSPTPTSVRTPSTVTHDESKSASLSEDVSEEAEQPGSQEPPATARRASNLQVTTNLSQGTPPIANLSPPDERATESTAQMLQDSRHSGSTPESMYASVPIINRRTSRLKQSPSHSEHGNTPRSLEAQLSNEAVIRRTPSYETPESLSPGQRKQPGAFAGQPGSGILLEGWLRQKQRRGMKGMKKWNSRYFVLYAKTNEVRYYADVVPSAWGPIPLGEIGSISLRLIQKISKPSHPKYKGCRFDITCRNAWGTHYADDYVSSEDDNDEDSGNAKPPDKSNTPKSSRNYSLIADSPQVAVTWVNMLDSLLVRSANSPRPDVAGRPSALSVGGASSSSKLKKMSASKLPIRRRSSALLTDTYVLCGPNDAVPKAVTYSIHYIFNSTPGVETERFYEMEADPAKLRVCRELVRLIQRRITDTFAFVSQNALAFLNRYAEDGVTQKPSKDELEAVLDPVTAGAVVKTWLKQLEGPVVPFEMYADFRALAAEATLESFDLKRNLKALLDMLPKKNRFVPFLSRNCAMDSWSWTH